MFKKLVLILWIVLSIQAAYAQKTEDVVYLTNGKVLRGTIIEENADGLRLVSTDKTIFDVNTSSIRKRETDTLEIVKLRVPQTNMDVPYGYFGGITVSNYIADGITPDPRFGAHIGVFVERKLNEHFSFIPEIQITMKGGKYNYKDAQDNVIDDEDPEGEDDGIDGAVETTEIFPMYRNDLLVYIHVPVLFTGKLYLPQGYLFAGIGPYFSYGLFSHTFDVKQNAYSRQRETPPFYYNIYNHYDFGAACRLGYQTKGTLFFQLGYEVSILDMRPNDHFVSGETKYSIRNAAFTLSVGRRLK